MESTITLDDFLANEPAFTPLVNEISYKNELINALLQEHLWIVRNLTYKEKPELLEMVMRVYTLLKTYPAYGTPSSDEETEQKKDNE